MWWLFIGSAGNDTLTATFQDDKISPLRFVIGSITNLSGLILSSWNVAVDRIVLIGSAGNDTLTGTNFADIFTNTGLGTNTLNGRLGNDTYNLADGDIPGRQDQPAEVRDRSDDVQPVGAGATEDSHVREAVADEQGRRIAGHNRTISIPLKAPMVAKSMLPVLISSTVSWSPLWPTTPSPGSVSEPAVKRKMSSPAPPTREVQAGAADQDVVAGARVDRVVAGAA